MRFATRRRAVLDSLSANAYGMYLVHYPFVVWMQYALLDAPLPAIVKARVVFAVAVVASWAVTAALRSIPLGARLIGAEPAGACESAVSALRRICRSKPSCRSPPNSRSAICFTIGCG